MSEVLSLVMTFSLLAETAGELIRADDQKAHKTDLPRGAVATVGWPAKEGLQNIAHEGPVWRMAFSPDGKLFATMEYNNSVCLWDITTRKMKWRIEGPEERIHWSFISFSKGGDVLAIPHDTKSIRFIDTATGVESKLVTRVKWKSLDPYDIAYSPDHLFVGMRTFISGEPWQGLLRAWDVRKAEETFVVKLPTHSPAVKAMAYPIGHHEQMVFSNDAVQLASAVADGKIRVWSTCDGKEIQTLTGHTVPAGSIAFSPDNRFLVSSSAGRDSHWVLLDNTIRLWDVKSGKQLSSVTHQTDVLSAPVFSPDGRTIAFIKGEEVRGKDFVKGDFSAHIYELSTARELLCFQAPPTRMRMVVFSPDGKMLASAMSNGTAILWDTAPEHWEKPKAKLDVKQINQLWGVLAGEDAPRTQNAIWTLSASPDEAIDFLKGRMSVIPPKAPADLVALIADLNHDDFDRREAASKELARLINQAEPLLRDALETTKSPEQSKRLKTLLKGRETWAIQDPDLLQAVRAIWVLQRIGTPEAKALLEKLAAGAPTARQTQEAQAALDFLKKTKQP